MIRALTLDLDDTLWPIEPVIARAEAALDAWLYAHCPEVARAWPIPAMRELRERVYLEHPELAHDFTTLRKISLRRVFAPFALGEDWVERAFEVFFAARNAVELYPEAGPALTRLASRWPLASLSNGNADLRRIGLAGHFAATVSAREVGVAKPEPGIFHHAAERLGLPTRAIAHVGDDPLLDVVGAHRAGMVSVWLNRGGAPWTDPDVRPDVVVSALDELEPALDHWCASQPSVYRGTEA